MWTQGKEITYNFAMTHFWVATHRLRTFESNWCAPLSERRQRSSNRFLLLLFHLLLLRRLLHHVLVPVLGALRHRLLHPLPGAPGPDQSCQMALVADGRGGGRRGGGGGGGVRQSLATLQGARDNVEASVKRDKSICSISVRLFSSYTHSL